MHAALVYAAERAGVGGQVLIAHVYGPALSWFGAPSYQPASEDYLRAGQALAAAAEDEIPAGVRHGRSQQTAMPTRSSSARTVPTRSGAGLAASRSPSSTLQTGLSS